jgi:hypothetical protein
MSRAQRRHEDQLTEQRDAAHSSPKWRLFPVHVLQKEKVNKIVLENYYLNIPDSLGFYKEKLLPCENTTKSGLFRSIFYLRKRRTPDRGESGPGQPGWESFCSDPHCPARNIFTEDCSFKI